MKYSVSALLLLASLSAYAEPANVNASVTYNIAVQNESGVDKQTVAVPVGGAVRELKMVGGVVQINPPAMAGGRSVIKFFSGSGATPVLMHTATITSSPEKPIQIAYTLCGQLLRYQSPAPDKLERCPAVASDNVH
jgi:hypothetical protein